MASIIRIKRSPTAGNPTTLGAGELAYSALSGTQSNGGDRLYIGFGNETSGDAANHFVIGGKYFTDMLDHVAGTLTASSALIADASSKLDNLKVDNLDLNGNTISTTDSNGNLTLAPNGTGKVSLTSSNVSSSTSTGALVVTGGVGIGGALYVGGGLSAGASSFTSINNTPIGNSTASTGAFTTLSASSTLTVTGAATFNGGVNIGADTLAEFIYDTVGGAITAGNGIDITNSDASNTSTVSLNTEYVQDLVGDMVSSNTESGISVTYDDSTGKLNFDVNDPTITIAGDVDGNATMTNLGNTTITVTLDTVNSNVGQFGSTTAIPVVTVNAKGLVTAVSTASISTTLGISSDSGTDSIALSTDTLAFVGGEGIDTSINSATNTVTIAAEDATTTNKGVASFATADFNVTSGAVELNDAVVKSVTTDSGALTPSTHGFSILGGEGIDVTHAGTTITVAGEDATTNNKGVASFATANFTVTAGDVTAKNITLGSSTLTLGSTTTAVAGITQLDVDNIRVDGNTISSTDTNGNIVLDPNGTGVIDVSATRITNLAEPSADSDAATKYYVDAARSGLDIKNSVKAATTANITLSNTQTIDGVALSVGDRVLVKDQSTASQNGIYVVASGAWARSTDADAPAELNPGTFVFVEQGTINDNTGFVVVSNSVVTIGTDNIDWTLFSASGTLIAGNGLSKNGYTLEVNVSGTGGIEISSDALQLKSTVAGDGLTLTSGVLAVVGTANRITVAADAIDIASTYVGQSTITTLGTITTGVWNGTVITGEYGGTGVNNSGKTITLGGNLTTSGAHATTLTTTGTTSVTLPTTGTLATLAGTETFTNKTLTSPVINGATINSSNIGATTAGTGAFTTLTASGATTFTSATASSSSTTGAVVVTGGVGVGGSIFGAGAGTSTLDGFNIDGGTY